MQNKGLIGFFAVLLTLICLFYLSFTVVTRGIEDDAVAYADGDIKKEAAYLDSMQGEKVYNLLIKEYSYGECKEREIALGLDLRGGMNVTLEVSLIDMIRALSLDSDDEAFNQALDLAKEKQASTQEDFVTLFGKAYAEVAPDGQLVSIFGYNLKDKITQDATNADVLKVVRQEAEDAIDRTFNVLRTRIDKFGVTQPNIQRLEGSDRILVELPGVKDPERVRKLLQGTAKLEFWETYENKDIFPIIEQADQVLKKIISPELVEDSAATASVDGEETSEEQVNEEPEIEEQPDSGEVGLEELFGTDEDDTSSVSTPVAGANLEKENPLLAIFSPNIYQQNGQYVLGEGPLVGVCQVKDTAKINDYLSRKQVKALFPRDLKLLWHVKPYADNDGRMMIQLIAIKMSKRDGKAPLEGDVVVDARQDYSQFGAKPEVEMVMNAEGANAWAKLTEKNKGKSVAIVLDDYVYSFPTVQDKITGGRSSITGNFTINEAKDLANILKAGKLPAPAKIVEEAVVGPSLGKESIKAGMYSFIAAIILVLIFMILYYNNAGIVANIALIANVFFIFGVLASLGAVLTLPGIAGIVLTIGISIDTNVLIFERIREELAKGTGKKLAIAEGYKHAYSAIIDANATSLLTGIILYIFGSGPIQGFATTFIIGIFCSLFAAILITRLIFDWQLGRGKDVKYSTNFSERAFKNTAIDFIGKRRVAYLISGIAIAAGLTSYFVRDFNYGVDFLGGRSYVVSFEEPVSVSDVNASLTTAFDNKSPSVVTFGSPKMLKIVTAYRIDDASEQADSLVEAKLFEGLQQFYSADMTFEKFNSISEDNPIGKQSSQKVGPTIADDIKDAALSSVLFSLVVIFLYILLRFRKWQFSLGAVVALFHDVLIILGLFAMFHHILPFSMEIDQAFIAAILTVIGYSINDTVVVFDRIREYQQDHPLRAKNTIKVINDALNSTLSRTVVTGLTTFIVLLVLFLFGGETIKGFSFALLVGVVVGTYSSIFIATPVVVEFYKKEKADEGKE